MNYAHAQKWDDDTAARFADTTFPQPFSLPERAFGTNEMDAALGWALHAAELFDAAKLPSDAETGLVDGDDRETMLAALR